MFKLRQIEIDNMENSFMPIWLVPVLLRVFVGNGLGRWMIKKVVGSHSRTHNNF